MARRFAIGDKVVPSRKKMPHGMQIVIGEEVGTVLNMDAWSLQVQYSFGRIIGYRDQFNRHSSSPGNREHSGTSFRR